MSYGIDTIKVGFKVNPDLIDFVGWIRMEEFVVKESGDILFLDFYLNEHKTQSGSIITLKYVHKNYRGKLFHMLFIEFSLPKLINGCNHRDIDDWEKALDQVNKTIASIKCLPNLPDIRQGILYRIDIYANFHVGDDVSEYIFALGKAHRSRRKAMHYSDTGILFKATEISVTVYDKERECKHKDAHGILRLEVSIRKKRKIEEYLGKEYARLGKISFGLLRERIQMELKLLSLDKPILSDRSQVEARLSQTYSSKSRVLKLLGYWDARQTMTREQMVKEGYAIRTIRYSEKLLTAAGISINANIDRRALPALVDLLALESAKSKVQILSQTPSDTRKNIPTKGDKNVKKTRSRRRQHVQAQERFVGCPNDSTGETGYQIFQDPKRWFGLATANKKSSPGGADSFRGSHDHQRTNRSMAGHSPILCEAKNVSAI